jgi:chemotaxis protein MotB
MFTNNYQKIQNALRDLEADQKLTLLAEENRITIRISESMLFEPGTDTILKEGLPVIDEVAAALSGLPNSIRVEGHTDNIPVNTVRFPSNWDLSSAERDPHLLRAGYDRKLSASASASDL